jgi:succinoglycan biosynthesis protein ExoA
MTPQDQKRGETERAHKSLMGSVLVVVPCLNEAPHIQGILTGLLAEADRLPMRIAVADGGSTDATRSIVASVAERDQRVVLIENAHIVQSAGVNLAVKLHGSEAKFLIRIDAHAEYPQAYCEQLLAVQARTRADSIVVSMQTKGKTCFQRAAAAAQNSVLGNGGATHRNAARDQWVDHGHHALMKIEAFSAVGGYDESFAQVEDVELDIRLRDAGFRIFLTSEASVTYYPRRSLGALCLQYFRVGKCRARNFLKHRKEVKLRHFALACPAPAIMAIAFSPIFPFFAWPALVWAVFCLGYGLRIGMALRDPCAAAAGITAIASQASWSLGFWSELLARFGNLGDRGAPESAAADQNRSMR